MALRIWLRLLGMTVLWFAAAMSVFAGPFALQALFVAATPVVFAYGIVLIRRLGGPKGTGSAVEDDESETRS